MQSTINMLRSLSSSSGGDGGGTGATGATGTGTAPRGSLGFKSMNSTHDKTDETVRTLPPPQPRPSFATSPRLLIALEQQSSHEGEEVHSKKSQKSLQRKGLGDVQDQHLTTIVDLTSNMTMEAMNQTNLNLNQANHSVSNSHIQNDHSHVFDEVYRGRNSSVHNYNYNNNNSKDNNNFGTSSNTYFELEELNHVERVAGQPVSFNTEVPVKEVGFTYSGAVFGRNRRRKIQSEQGKGTTSSQSDCDVESKSSNSEENKEQFTRDIVGCREGGVQEKENPDQFEGNYQKTLPTVIATSMNSFASEPDQEIILKPANSIKAKLGLASVFAARKPAAVVAASNANVESNQLKTAQQGGVAAGGLVSSSIASRWFTRKDANLNLGETNKDQQQQQSNESQSGKKEGLEQSPTFNERKPFYRRILGMNPTPDTATPKKYGREEGGDDQTGGGQSSPKKLNLFSGMLKSQQTLLGASIEEKVVKRKWNLAVQLKNVNRFISKIRDQTQNQNFTKLLPLHLNMIGDKSFEQEGGSKEYFDTGPKENEENSASSLLRKVPIFDPDDGMLIAFKIVVLLVSVVLLFLVPFVFSFEINEEDFSLANLLIFQEIPLGIFVCDVVCRLNTGFYLNGQFVQDRKQIPRFFAFILALDALNILAIAMNRVISPGVLIAVFLIRFVLVYTKTGDILEHVPLLERYPMFYNLSKLAFILLIILHSCGCGFHYVAISQDSMTQNWLEYYNFNNFSIWNRYLVSIYYSTITMITVGYGDITPQTQAERLYVIAVVIVSGTVFAYTVNMIGQLFQDKEKKIAVFKQVLSFLGSVDDLNNKNVNKIRQKKFDISNYMVNRSISKKTQLRVYNYLDYINTKENESPEKGQMILSEISENLRNEVYREFYGKILTNSKLFSNKFSNEFITKLTLHMQEKMFGPGEIIFQEGQQTNACLYYILKGKIEMSSKHHEVKHSLGFLGEGDSLGHRCFNASQPHDWSAITSEVTHLVYVSQQTFLECLKEFPLDHESFMMMKDEIIFGQNRYLNPCHSCGKVTHLSVDCPLIHYSKNRQLCIHKHQHYAPEKDRKAHARYRTRKSRLFAMLSLTKQALKKIRLELMALHSKVYVPMSYVLNEDFDSAESDRDFFGRMTNKFKFTENSNSLVLDSRPSESETEEEDYDDEDEDSSDEKGILNIAQFNGGNSHHTHENSGVIAGGVRNPAIAAVKAAQHQDLSKISDDSEEPSDDSILAKDTKSQSKNSVTNRVAGAAEEGGSSNSTSDNREAGGKQKQRFFRGSLFKFDLDDILGSESNNTLSEEVVTKQNPLGNNVASTVPIGTSSNNAHPSAIRQQRSISPIGVATVAAATSVTTHGKVAGVNRRNSMMNMQPIKLLNPQLQQQSVGLNSSLSLSSSSPIGLDKKSLLMRQGTGGDLSVLTLMRQDSELESVGGADTSALTIANMHGIDSPAKQSPLRRNTRAQLQHLNLGQSNPKELSLFSRRHSVNVSKVGSKAIGGGIGLNLGMKGFAPTSKFSKQAELYGSPLIWNPNTIGRAIGIAGVGGAAVTGNVVGSSVGAAVGGAGGTNGHLSMNVNNSIGQYYGGQNQLLYQQSQSQQQQQYQVGVMAGGANIGMMNVKKKDEFFFVDFDAMKEYTVYYPMYNHSNIVKKLNTKITQAKKKIMTLIPQNVSKRLRKRTNTVRLAQVFIPGKKKVDSITSVAEEEEQL